MQYEALMLSRYLNRSASSGREHDCSTARGNFCTVNKSDAPDGSPMLQRLAMIQQSLWQTMHIHKISLPDCHLLGCMSMAIMNCATPLWALMAERSIHFDTIDMQLMCGSRDPGELRGRLPVCVLEMALQSFGNHACQRREGRGCRCLGRPWLLVAVLPTCADATVALRETICVPC